jgi:RHS repeat-associated protein
LRAFYIQASSGSEPSVYTHYLYDGEGNRIKKLTRKDSGKVEVTVYIDDVFEESYIKPSGSSIDSNHHWNTLHVMDASSRVATIRAGTDNNDSTPAIKYNLEDHLGSSSVMVDDTGTLVNREEYYPFGDTSFGGFAKKRYRYTGKEKDEESGLYYYGARYYAPWTCRFISVDPEAGKNMNKSSYNYTSNNPLNRIDPTGGNDKPKDGGGDNGGGSKSSGNGGKGKNEKGGSNQSGGETPDVVNLKENQTLWDLAQKYEDVTVEKIKRLNEDIPEKHAVDNIPVGEEIQLKEKPKQSNQGKSTQNKEGSWFVNEKTGSILFIKGKEKMSERQKEKYGDNWNRLKVGKEFSKNVDIPDRIEQGSSYKLGPDSAKDLMEKYGYRKAYKVEILKIEREQTRFESDSPLTQSWSKERISDKEITYVKPEEFGIINSYIYDRKFDSHSGIRTTERVVNKYVAYSEEGPQTDINNWSDSWKGILKGIIELLN